MIAPKRGASNIIDIHTQISTAEQLGLPDRQKAVPTGRQERVFSENAKDLFEI